MRARLAAYILALSSGASLTLAFAPFDAWWLGILAPALLVVLWSHQSVKQGVLRGFYFGLGLFVTGTSWVYVSIHHFGGAPVVVASALSIAFAIVLALFFALQGAVYCWLAKHRQTLAPWVLFPSLWVLFEWLRSWVFTGFPWLLLGYTQMHSPLSGFAPIGSVYLVGWLTLFSCVLLAQLLAAKTISKRAWCIITLSVIMAIGYCCKHTNFTTPSGKSFQVTLVQGDQPPLMKWSPGYVRHAIGLYSQQTLAHLHSRLIIWPESAITAFPQQLKPWLASLNKLLNQHGSAVITGIPYYQNHHYYNAAIALGNAHGHYFKRHLVPFGEYTPLKTLVGPVLNFMHLPMSNFSNGPDQQKPITLNGLPISVWICYESAFPQEVRNHLEHSGLMINISDDAWFGHSLGQWQHAQMAQMRALETGRYMLTVTNTGVTAIYNSHGRQLKHLTPFTRDSLTGDAVAMQGETPWVQFGLWPWLILWFVMVLVFLFCRKDQTSL